MKLYYGMPPRKWAEFLVAAYGVFLGAWGWAAARLGASIFYWAGYDADQAGRLSVAILFSGGIHAIGTHINGRWRWSPLLRFVGLTGHVVLIGHLACLAAAVGRATSAQPTYFFLSFLFISGWMACGADAWRAITGRPQKWSM